MQINIVLVAGGDVAQQTAGCLSAEILHLKEIGNNVMVSLEGYHDAPDEARAISAVKACYNDDTDALVLIRGDIAWEVGDIGRIAEAALDKGGIVGGAVPHSDLIMGTWDDRPPLSRIEAIHADFTAYSRAALDKLRSLDGKHFYDLFIPEVVGDDYRRGPIMACRRLGVPVYLHSGVKVERRIPQFFHVETQASEVEADVAPKWKSDGRPRVLLAIDRPDWSFDNIAKQLQKNLSEDFDFQVVPYQLVAPGTECDVLVAFWWNSLQLLLDKVKCKKSLVCVYDGFSWTMDPIGEKNFWDNVVKADAVGVANRQIRDQLVEDGRIAAPVPLIEDGVDLGLFQPRLLPEKFRVGWTGNSETSQKFDIDDLKGLKLIREACNIAGVELDVLDAAGGVIHSHESMASWYHGISCYCCASMVEGTPNPILEAMACARPVVSTSVGLVPKIVKKGGVIVERSPDALARGILQVRDNIQEMAKAAISEIQPWSWTLKAQEWKKCLTSLTS